MARFCELTGNRLMEIEGVVYWKTMVSKEEMQKLWKVLINNKMDTKSDPSLR